MVVFWVILVVVVFVVVLGGFAVTPFPLFAKGKLSNSLRLFGVFARPVPDLCLTERPLLRGILG